jgi:hypothetical protein
MAAEAFEFPKELATVSLIFEHFCAEQALTVLVEAIDKHGSWEWAAVSPGEISRFVSLAFTEQPDKSGTPLTYSSEVWAEAEKGHQRRRAQRILASTFCTDAEAIAQSTFEAQLLAALTEGWQRANLLTEHDLHDLPAPALQ